MVFGCHIYLTLCGLCFSLYIATAHYSILQFHVCLPPCKHVLLTLCAPGCNIKSFRWTQPCWALHLRLMLQFGYIINCLSLPCSAVSSFWCKFRVIFAFSWSWNLYSLSKFMCMNWLVLISSKIKLNSLYMFAYFFYLLFLTCNFVIAICYCSTIHFSR